MGLAIARCDLTSLDHALFLPEGYHIKAVQQANFENGIALLLESDAIPKTEEGQELPNALLLVTVSYAPDGQSGYRKYTTEVQLSKA